MGSGTAIKKTVREYLNTREAAEKIQEAAGSMRELRQVRHGTFAEEGIVGEEYLPMGAGGNILPAAAAEYESFAIDTVINTSAVKEDAKVGTVLGKRRLIVPADGEGEATNFNSIYIDPTTVSRYVKYGPDETTYIFSAYAYKIAGMGDDNYVGIRITVADDEAGNGAVIIYEDASDAAGLTRVEGVTGAAHRVHAKFTVPLGKPFVRIDYKQLHNPAKYVAWSHNMLEIVKDSRSVPSKYTAPTPGAGEVSSEQLAFDANPNIFPYNFATLALGAGGIDYAYIDGVQQGLIDDVPEKPGFVFVPSNTGTGWWAPAVTAFEKRTAAFEGKFPAGQQYIVSAFVEYLEISDPAPPTATVTMRVGTANNITDLTTRTGTWAVRGTSQSFTLTEGERKRIWLKYTHQPSGFGALGPRVEFRTTLADGSNVPFTVEFDSLQMEAVTPATTQPSTFKPPLAGSATIDYSQLKIKDKEIPYKRLAASPNAGIERSNTQVIANGADVQIDFGATVLNQAMGLGSVAPPKITIDDAGVYLLSLLAVIDLDIGSTTRMGFVIRVTGPTDYRIMSIIQPNISGTPAMEGNIILPLSAGDEIRARVTNSSGSGSRNLNFARLTVSYLGDIA